MSDFPKLFSEDENDTEFRLDENNSKIPSKDLPLPQKFLLRESIVLITSPKMVSFFELDILTSGTRTCSLLERG